MFGEFNKLKLKNIAKNIIIISGISIYISGIVDNKLLEIYLCKILRQYANYLRKVFYWFIL